MFNYLSPPCLVLIPSESQNAYCCRLIWSPRTYDILIWITKNHHIRNKSDLRLKQQFLDISLPRPPFWISILIPTSPSDHRLFFLQELRMLREDVTITSVMSLILCGLKEP